MNISSRLEQCSCGNEKSGAGNRLMKNESEDAQRYEYATRYPTGISVIRFEPWCQSYVSSP